MSSVDSKRYGTTKIESCRRERTVKPRSGKFMSCNHATVVTVCHNLTIVPHDENVWSWSLVRKATAQPTRRPETQSRIIYYVVEPRECTLLNPQVRRAKKQACWGLQFPFIMMDNMLWWGSTNQVSQAYLLSCDIDTVDGNRILAKGTGIRGVWNAVKLMGPESPTPSALSGQSGELMRKTVHAAGNGVQLHPAKNVNGFEVILSRLRMRKQQQALGVYFHMEAKQTADGAVVGEQISEDRAPAEGAPCRNKLVARPGPEALIRSAKLSVSNGSHARCRHIVSFSDGQTTISTDKPPHL
jgi:hypothetical protein